MQLISHVVLPTPVHFNTSDSRNVRLLGGSPTVFKCFCEPSNKNGININNMPNGPFRSSASSSVSLTHWATLSDPAISLNRRGILTPRNRPYPSRSFQNRLEQPLACRRAPPKQRGKVMTAMPDDGVHLNEVFILVPLQPVRRVSRHDSVEGIMGCRRPQAQQVAFIADAPQDFTQVTLAVTTMQVIGE